MAAIRVRCLWNPRATASMRVQPRTTHSCAQTLCGSCREERESRKKIHHWCLSTSPILCNTYLNLLPNTKNVRPSSCEPLCHSSPPLDQNPDQYSSATSS